MNRSAHATLARLSRAQLEALAKRLRRLGELPRMSELVGICGVEMAHGLDTALSTLEAGGMTAHQLSMACELAAEVQRQEHATRPELVWTGPEPDRSVLRDTELVVCDLLRRAQEQILVTSYNLDSQDQAFQSTFSELMRVMELRPGLRVTLVLNVQHSQTQRARRESSVAVLQNASEQLVKLWGEQARPSVYYDPRALVIDTKTRPVQHAKCVVIDGQESFVTSANFTQAAHKRNIELGVLLHDAHIARQIQAQFDGLIERAWLCRLPRW